MRRRFAAPSLPFVSLVLVLAACRGERKRDRQVLQVEVESPDGSPRTAALACQRFVQQRLRGPRAAKFPGDDSTAVMLAPARWRVVSYVEAIGVPGGANRFAYTCDVTKVNQGGAWRLDSLTIK